MNVMSGETTASSTSVSTPAAGFPQRVKDYYEDLKQEMKRVSWPAWKTVRATTAVVIGSVFIFAIYFAVVDAVIGRGIEKLFNTFAK